MEKLVALALVLLLAALLWFGVFGRSAPFSSSPSDWRPRRDRMVQEEHERAEIDAQREIDDAYVFDYVAQAIEEKRDIPGLARFSMLRAEHWSEDGQSVRDCDADREACGKEAERRSRERFQERYPAALIEASIERLTKEAEERFALYKLGDKVSFVIRGGRGPGSRVEGTFIELLEERLRIGNRLINRMDLDEETEARFYVEVHERVKRNYLIVQKAREQAILENRMDDIRQELYPPIFIEAGFIPDVTIANSDWRSGRLDTWITPQMLADKLQSTLQAQTRTRLFQENMARSGYVFADPGSGTAEWIPERVLRQQER
jgi:hypothetical protein